MLKATHKLNHSFVALSVVWAVEQNGWNETIKNIGDERISICSKKTPCIVTK